MSAVILFVEKGVQNKIVIFILNVHQIIRKLGRLYKEGL